MATRALIFIEADNMNILSHVVHACRYRPMFNLRDHGLRGRTSEKGDWLGMVHYGGSTYCPLFRSETNLRFGEEVKKFGENASIPLSTWHLHLLIVIGRSRTLVGTCLMLSFFQRARNCLVTNKGHA